MNTLLELQKLDLKIQNRKARELEIPKQKDKYKIRRQRLNSELKASEDRSKTLVLEQRECEGEIEQRRAQIAKYDTQLLAVKKNEEYQALLHEIEILKKQISVKEERIIAILLEIDEANERLVEDKRRIEAELADIDGECKKIDDELAEAVKDREELEAQRVPLVSNIDPALLNRYDRILRSKKGGAAVVPLRGDFCSGCNMVIRPQIVNEVLAGEKIHACNHCGRLLYHAENFEKAVEAGASES